MKLSVTLATLSTLLMLQGCGGTVDRSCDEVRQYQLAREGRRIEPPPGLDPLDELDEIPLPKASPQAQRTTGLPCIDLPPNILAE